MKLSKHLFLLLLIGLPYFIHAQVPIQGELKLGDTTQVHVLKTAGGDRFTGLVTGFDQEKLLFQYRGNVLEFPLGEIESVEVVSPIYAEPDEPEEVGATPVPKDPNNSDPLQEMLVEPIGQEAAKQYIWPFEYRVKTTSGVEYTGILSRINGRGLMLGRGGSSSLPFNKVSGIELMGNRIDTHETPLNEHHRLKTTDADIFTGQLLSYDGENYVFLMQNGSELTFPQYRVEYLYLVKKARNSNSPEEKTRIAPHRYYNQQRVFFTPSAFLLEEGTKEFRTMLIQNSVDFGLSDNINVGVGLNTIIVASV